MASLAEAKYRTLNGWMLIKEIESEDLLCRCHWDVYSRVHGLGENLKRNADRQTQSEG